MKIVHKSLKKGLIKLEIQNADDLWFLSQVIQQGDIVSGKTTRKIKQSEENQRSSRVFTITAFVKISVEKVEFAEGRLRVSGKVTEAPEQIPRGSYHSFNIEPGTVISIEKEWHSYHLARIGQAVKQSSQKLLIVLFDRSHAVFAELTSYGYKLLAELKGNVKKKAFDENISSCFYSQIAAKIKEYDYAANYAKIIIASNSFWKEYLIGKLDSSIKQKAIFSSCNSIGVSGINEVLKRPELTSALKDAAAAKDAKLIDSILSEIKKQGLVAYGIDEVEKAAEAGAIKELVVADSFLHDNSKEHTERLFSILKSAELQKAKLHFASASTDAGKQLIGLGGVAAILRYSIA